MTGYGITSGDAQRMILEPLYQAKCAGLVDGPDMGLYGDYPKAACENEVRDDWFQSGLLWQREGVLLLFAKYVLLVPVALLVLTAYWANFRSFGETFLNRSAGLATKYVAWVKGTEH
jgi:hypothetical protein